MTSQEPYTQHLPDPDSPDTEVILVEQPAPVFVDSTGRRRRLLRRFSYGFGAFCMVYGGLVSLSLAGGPVSPDAVLPFPDLITGGGNQVAEAVTTRPAPRPPLIAPKAVVVDGATPGSAKAALTGTSTGTGTGTAANRTAPGPPRAGRTPERTPKPRAVPRVPEAGRQPVPATRTARPGPAPTPAGTSTSNSPPPATPATGPTPASHPNVGPTGGPAAGPRR